MRESEPQKGNVEASERQPGIGRNRRLVTQVLITLGAAIAIAVHLRWPELKFDATTLGLIAIAVLPWLGALFTEIRVPGVVEAVFRELEQVSDQTAQTAQTVNTLANQVDNVVSVITFSGAVSKGRDQRLNTALGDYMAYLERLGVPVPPVDDVHIEPGQVRPGEPVSIPEPDCTRIVISESVANNSDLLFHEYTHCVLEKMAGTPRPTWAGDFEGVETGLAFYLPCSYKDDPRVFPVDLTNRSILEFRDYMDRLNQAHRTGFRWAGAFWEIRAQLGRDVIDRPLLTAWREMSTKRDADEADFVKRLSMQLQQSTASAPFQVVGDAVERWGLRSDS